VGWVPLLYTLLLTDMKISLLFACPVGASLAACSLLPVPEKSEPTLVLPPVSAVGANTLGFEVDGRMWTTYGQKCFGLLGNGCKDNTLYASSYRFPGGGRRQLSVSTSLDTEQHREFFELELDSLGGPGVYAAGRARTLPLGVSYNTYGPTLTDVNERTNYVGGSRNAVQVILTRVDTVQRIVAGTFEGRLEKIATPGQCATLRRGRFDVKY
jgi:hypothetical protein